MLVYLFLIYTDLWIHLFQIFLQILDFYLHFVDPLGSLCLFFLNHFHLFSELSDEMLILTLISDLASFLLKVVHVKFLLSGLVELHPDLDFLQPFFDLLLLLLVFYHVTKCLLMLPIEFLDARCVLQQLVNLELVHKSHLIDFSLLEDIERIRIRKSQTFNEAFIFWARKRLFLNSQLLTWVRMPDPFNFVEIDVCRLLRGFTTNVKFHYNRLRNIIHRSLSP